MSNYKYVPDDLKKLKSWLTWNFVQTTDGGKPRKMPYYINGKVRSGEQGSTADIQQLGTFTEAITAMRSHAHKGLGIAMLGHDITALDFDNCVVDGVVDPEISSLVCSTYAEISPSGKGVRAFVKGSYGDFKTSSLELFTKKGFVTVTGDVLDINKMLDVTKITEGSPELIARIRTVSQRSEDAVVQVSSMSPEDARLLLSYIDPDINYNDWVHIGMSLQACLGDEGLDLWDEWSSKGAKYPSYDSLAAKWDTFGRRAGITDGFLRKCAADGGWCDVSTSEFPIIPEGNRKSLFTIMPACEFAASGEDAGWWIKDVFPKAPLIMIYGASGSGKSFLALDIAASISRGAMWQDKAVTQGRVLYVCAEGATGFKHRIKAYQRHNAVLLEKELQVLAGVTPGFNNPVHMSDLVNRIKEGNFEIVCIDTLAQSLPGADENSGKDLGVFLTSCKQIAAITGASVVVIHHSGKDEARGSRGHSSLPAACDAIIEVTRKDTERKLKVVKMKDGEDGFKKDFQLEPVELDLDVTSCVVQFSESKGRDHNANVGVNEMLIMDYLGVFSEATSGELLRDLGEVLIGDKKSSALLVALDKLAKARLIDVVDGCIKLV